MKNVPIHLPTVFRRSLLLILMACHILPPVSRADTASSTLNLTEKERDWLKANPKIPIIADPDGAPYSHMNERGEFSGILSDVFRRFEELTGSSVVFEPAHYDEIVEHVAAGKQPVITGFDPPDYPAYTEAYRKSQDIAFLPFALFALRHHDPDAFKPKNMKGKKVAIIEGWDPDHPALRALGECELVHGETDLDCANMVMEGKADAVFEIAVLQSYVILNNQLNDMRLMKVSPYGMPITILTHHDMDALHTILDKVLSTFSPEERSSLLTKWEISPQDQHYKLIALELSDAERNWLANHLTLRVGISPDHKPIEWENAEGELLGLNTEYFNLLEKNLGMTFEYVRAGTPEEGLKLLEQRNVDIVAGAITQKNVPDYLLYTPPYFTQNIKVYVHKNTGYIRNLSDLNGKKLGITRTLGLADSIRKDFPLIEVMEFDHTEEGVRALNANQIDALAGDRLLTGQSLIDLNLKTIKIGGQTPYTASLSMATRSDWPMLSTIITKALAQIEPHQKSEIFSNWAPRPPENADYTFLWKAGLPILALLLIVLTWNRQLKREVKRRTLALEAEQMLLKKAETIASLGHWKLDLKTEQTRFSEEIYNILGLNPAKTTPTKELFKELAHPDDEALVRQISRQAIEERIPVAEDFRLLLHDNTVKHVHLQCQHIRNENGEPVHLIGILQDVTERIQMEESLHQSEKLQAVGRLAGGIAHDFNNMLGGISGATELLGMRIQDDPEALEYHDMVLKTTKRAAKLTRNLLSFSRKQPLAARVIDIHQLILESVNLLKSSIDKRTRIELQLDAKSSSVIGDASLLQNAILNIGINCAHAMPSGGIIRIKTELNQLEHAEFQCGKFDIAPGTFLKITISDTGCGMSHQTQSRVFEPFFTTKDLGKGTGLGLATVFGTVQQHQGAIDFTSVIDSGTSFHIYLPLTNEQTDGTNTTVNIYMGKDTLLLVDDDPTVLKTTKEILTKLGYEVLCAENGADALQAYREKHELIKLVILDVVMPVMNGKDCFQALRQINPDIRILISTGFSTEIDVEDMLSAGRCDLLHKPYLTPTLSQAVHDALHL
ncbi:transporter substrate-binding domain-containing protein [Pontiellaceae bacterium B12219]|nr:transporter substrate-binding domain-containing protein [Pontiellaceae bacterium B12219]